jgi:hypothetical protein
VQTEGQGVARMHMQGGCRACGGWVGRRTQMCTHICEAIPNTHRTSGRAEI